MSDLLTSAAQAVSDVPDGATVLVSGFGLAGQPEELLRALLNQGATGLTVVCNNAGTGDSGLARLIAAGRVRKLVASYPRGPESQAFNRAYASGTLEYECVPQGTLVERLRAAGAGIGGFLTPTAFGTELARGKETRIIGGVGYVLEDPLPGDFALVAADRADGEGNLCYRKTTRNFGPVMCMAGNTVIAQVRETVPTGTLDPETIITPQIFVDRVVRATKDEEKTC